MPPLTAMALNASPLPAKVRGVKSCEEESLADGDSRTGQPVKGQHGGGRNGPPEPQYPPITVDIRF